jgi:cyclomaltodextrinase
MWKQILISLVLFVVAFHAHAASLTKNISGAVVYGVVPPLFGKEAFKSVTKKLDELKEQGADILWISPIQATNDPGHISYAITDFSELREDFGSQADLRELVDQAHHRGMRVILDFVANHSSDEHRFFLDADQKVNRSKYYDFYDRDKNGEPTHYFDWENLPNLNLQNRDVVHHLIDAFKHWVQTYEVDGFRLDAAWAVRERSPGFWPALRQELAKVRQDLILIAEATARDPYYFENGLDLAYDWSDQIGVWAWTKVFEEPEKAGDHLRQALESSAHPERTLRFLNNNDTGRRFISRYGVAKTRLAAILQYTVPGVPVLYTGDEIGAQYEPYKDPSPLKWSEDPHHLRDLYKRLATLRKTLPSLNSGEWTPLAISKSSSSYAFLRHKGDDLALIVANFAETDEFLIELPSQFTFSENAWDAISEKEIHLSHENGKLKLSVSGSSALFLLPNQP